VDHPGREVLGTIEALESQLVTKADADLGGGRATTVLMGSGDASDRVSEATCVQVSIRVGHIGRTGSDVGLEVGVPPRLRRILRPRLGRMEIDLPRAVALGRLRG
jgi:hypothetical protein